MLSVTKGDTLKFKFTRLDNDGAVVTSTPDSIYWTLKKSYYTEDYILQKGLGDMTTDEDGTYHVLLSADETDMLECGKYHFDLEVTQDGVVTTICKDYLDVLPEVTWKENKTNE